MRDCSSLDCTFSFYFSVMYTGSDYQPHAELLEAPWWRLSVHARWSRVTGERRMQIVFLPGEINDQQRWVVWFMAVVDGRQITCGISYQTLRDYFEADFDHPLPAF